MCLENAKITEGVIADKVGIYNHADCQVYYYVYGYKFVLNRYHLSTSRLEDNSADLIYTHYSKFLLTEENFEKLELAHWVET